MSKFEATGAVLTASELSALLTRQEISRGFVNFDGEELEPFQLELLAVIGIEAVNYEPIGAVREAARARVAECVARGPRFERDRLYARAKRWLENPHEGRSRFPPA